MKLLTALLMISLVIPTFADDDSNQAATKPEAAKPESGRLAKQKMIEAEKAKNKVPGGEAKKNEVPRPDAGKGAGHYLKMVDTNNDNNLSDDELQSFAGQVAKNYERTKNGLGKEADGNNDGKLNDDEIKSLRQKIKNKFQELKDRLDKNGDGKLNEDELNMQ